MSQRTYRFILQAQDPDHGCPVLERLLVVSDLGELRAVLGSIADDDPELAHAYRLESCDLTQIGRRLGVTFDWNRGDVWLCPWSSARNIPYLIHTGYELALMLEGRKPFAFFVEEYPPHRHSTEDHFDPHVAKGLLHKQVDVEPFGEPIRGVNGQLFEGVRTVCYALRGEEWRVSAWKLIREAAQKSRWNENFERLEGMLLGYDDWQNDWWIAGTFQSEAVAD
jgi:hypothetical protein